jgi:rhodanese-related sulfurtransferase
VVEGLVVGIFPQSDPKALESALAAQQIDLSRVKVVSSSAPDAADEEPSQLQFVDVIADMESNSLSDELTPGTGVLADSGGTGVPGISSGGQQPTLSSFTHHDDPTRRYFAAFAIPDDEVDNFGDAVAEGRAVVLYLDAGSDAQAVAAAFKAAGLRNVRAY